ncbi:hypothetical protein G3I27_28980, partial [Streptomyces sp. SID10692]|nr:hypothetical protein [Streptomyces sp. SID10692]
MSIDPDPGPGTLGSHGPTPEGFTAATRPTGRGPAHRRDDNVGHGHAG